MGGDGVSCYSAISEELRSHPRLNILHEVLEVSAKRGSFSFQAKRCGWFKQSAKSVDRNLKIALRIPARYSLHDTVLESDNEFVKTKKEI